MTCVPDCDDAMASVDVSRVVQLRAVLWSMRSIIATAREQQRAPRTLWFELQALADAGVTLTDSALDEASEDEAPG